ncbi:alcohol dehydrogenase catalytic domain-containing protein [Streptomyces bottropensis]|uniref:alcohol dehydrogenase catalytic domain-containing protein n=1 Tax=Streptomyces bottropensis TaxID=42235 RepID=UPI00368741C3
MKHIAIESPIGAPWHQPKHPNPGRTIAGVVEAVGSEVTGFAPGDTVYGTAVAAFAAARPERSAQAGPTHLRGAGDGTSQRADRTPGRREHCPARRCGRWAPTA